MRAEGLRQRPGEARVLGEVERVHHAAREDAGAQDVHLGLDRHAVVGLALQLGMLAQRRRDEHAAHLVELALDRAGDVDAAEHGHARIELGQGREPFLEGQPLAHRVGDQAGLEAYQTHPVHQEVLTFLRAKSAGSVAVDFET